MRGGVKKDEFNEKILDLRRVTRVTKGGKRFRFRATVIIGDEKGRVGAGIAKGLDVAQAVDKAKTDAKKKLIRVPLNGRTITHEVEAKFSAAKVRLKPAREGHGLIAGGAARTVLSLAGIKDITAKCIGRTPNKLTNALATIEALKMLKPKPKKVKTEKPKTEEGVKEETPINA
ncbi:MAG: 30S ribosomal protein S5 [Candidatus Harrisonbacteria bacterium CG10_big_fil_rev_8_21_14_0_10_40_38]|uniref:Small ribosomal subunit protein uS5 n=1 Tax=Candidatus Harrisonbacteria bacterium CG10_big_fil_rev_8_21_14_0_10_40_38 TaxID=1974583 RepID=A0A2H0UTB2_9BACT|nr:MAG: 30S ribosomal protein S5 [Candidatus Harrisonbacteria bacterium CG10_big_fil_rev_8_21_14_0_10_40_38]